MPLRWSIALEHPVPESVSPWDLHGMVSRWLDSDHWQQSKPYSLVPLHALDNDVVAFEVGALVDSVEPLLCAGVRALHRSGGRLGTYRCRAVDPEPTLVARCTWEELWEQASPERRFPVRFETPTTFRSGGISHPVPLPTSVVRSWNTRWRRFAPSALAAEVDLDVSRHAIAIAQLDGRTVDVETARLRPSKDGPSKDRWGTMTNAAKPTNGRQPTGSGRRRAEVGFVGEVTYQLHERGGAGTAIGRRFDALAGIAEFAGTGTSTTMGLGVTRYLKRRWEDNGDT